MTEIVRGWNGRRRTFDIGLMARDDGSTEAFAEAVGGGIFGEVLIRADAADDEIGGEDKRRRGLELLLGAIRDAAPRPWGVMLDGRDLSGDHLAVEAMNVRGVGAGLMLAPDADPGDGLLDVVLVGPEHRATLRTTVEALGRDPQAPPPDLPVHRGRELRLRVPPGCPLHVDDDPWPAPDGLGELRVRVRGRVLLATP